MALHCDILDGGPQNYQKLSIEWGDPNHAAFFTLRTQTLVHHEREARRWRKAPETLSGSRSRSKRERQPGGPGGSK